MDVDLLDAYLQKITQHQRKIVQLMYDAGGEWLTRAMVAKRLEKRRLTPYDINCLTLLSEDGILVTDTQPTTAPGSDFAYIYTMEDDIAEILQQWSTMQDTLNKNDTQKKTRRPINLADNK